MRSIAIVGRPNVGKSALFNRLAGRMISIVHDQAGVTRDRITAVCKTGNVPFEIVDTGGIGDDPDPDFSDATQEAAEIAILSADVLLFVVDAQSGVTPLDMEIARRLRSSKHPVILIVNKIDVDKHESLIAEFSRLGYPNTIAVSAAHGRGMGQLMDAINVHLPEAEEEVAEIIDAQPAPKLAMVGRPNVGKSSLINAILEDKRTIVSDIAGTTRDAVDVTYTREGREYVLVDTAGIRHRSKHNTSVEVFSVMRSEKTIDRADLNILVVDATVGVTAQDKKIAGLIQKARKAAIVVLNKWDLVAPDGCPPEFIKEQIEDVQRELFFLDYAPIVILSAKTGENIRRLFTMVEKMRQHATRRVGTGEFNRTIKAAMERQPPITRANKRLKILYSTQLVFDNAGPFRPPEFLLFVNDPSLLTDQYLHYLTARIRDKWEFPGFPIRLRLRGRESDARKKEKAREENNG